MKEGDVKEFFCESDCDEYSTFTGYHGSSQKKCISIDKANALLRQRGTVVYAHENMGVQLPGKKLIDFWCSVNDDHEYKALLINITPLEVDSAERVLKDLISEFEKIKARASQLLETK